jgi:hypothetical protein
MQPRVTHSTASRRISFSSVFLHEQPLQLADVLVSGAQLRGRHHLLAGASGGQPRLAPSADAR